MDSHVLIKALPKHISEHWGVIGQGLRDTAPEYFLNGSESLNNVLQSLLSGKMQCWIAMSGSVKDDLAAYGFVITTITYDMFSGVKNLLVVCIYSFRKKKADPLIYINSLEVLKKFAVQSGCKNIIGYTKVDKLAEFVERKLGGDASQRVITIPLEE